MTQRFLQPETRPADRHTQDDGCGDWINELYRGYPDGNDPLELPAGYSVEEQVEHEEAMRIEQERKDEEAAREHGTCFLCG